jgi:hypothetical protein
MPVFGHVAAEANLRVRRLSGREPAAGAKILGPDSFLQHRGQVAQLVEQRTENPCVGGSIPPLATIISRDAKRTAKSAEGFNSAHVAHESLRHRVSRP